MSSLCLTKTFFMRVVISDLRALLYVRSLRDKRVRASLFCAARTTNVPLAGVAVPAARANDPLRVRVSPSLIPHPSISSIARPRRANARAETDTNGPHAFNSTRIRARLPPFHRARPPPTARHRVHVAPHPRPRRRRAPTNRRRNRPTRARGVERERTNRRRKNTRTFTRQRRRVHGVGKRQSRRGKHRRRVTRRGARPGRGRASGVPNVRTFGAGRRRTLLEPCFMPCVYICVREDGHRAHEK